MSGLVVMLVLQGRLMLAGVEDLRITELLPLGGASVLLVYLLRLLMVERGRWTLEREAIIKEHRASIAEQRVDHLALQQQLKDRITELQTDRQKQRERIIYLEDENSALRLLRGDRDD